MSLITIMKKYKQKLFLISLMILLPYAVSGDCTCDAEDKSGNRSEALKYKIGAIFSIFVASLVGVCLPLLGKKVPVLSPDNNFFFIIKAFAAGVILATGFIHILPDAFESLTSPCLSENPWGNFPFAGFVSMVAAIGTLMVDVYATSHYSKSAGKLKNAVHTVENDEERRIGGANTHATHGPSHGQALSIDELPSTELRYRVISQVLELGIIVHSVIIGITIGASDSPKTVKPLFAALTFHQFFEGVGLGGCITQAKFKVRAAAFMSLFFSLTTPVGIAVGIGIASIYNENSPNALIVQGILDSASAGILVYMALVDLLAADFMNPRMQSNRKLQLGANASLLFGAGCMSVLAKWA